MADSARGTEEAILEAALTEVLEHGVRRTSASDIARRAGVSRQTLYRYWSDVQAVFAALVTRELLAVLPPLTRAASLDDLVAQLIETADAIRRLPIVDRLRDTDPELFSRYILERLGTSQRAMLGDLAGRVRAGQAAGHVREGDPRRLAAMVLLIAQSMIQSAPLVAEWLGGRAWRTELRRALRGYLAPDAA